MDKCENYIVYLELFRARNNASNCYFVFADNAMAPLLHLVLKRVLPYEEIQRIE